LKRRRGREKKKGGRIYIITPYPILPFLTSTFLSPSQIPPVLSSSSVSAIIIHLPSTHHPKKKKLRTPLSICGTQALRLSLSSRSTRAAYLQYLKNNLHNLQYNGIIYTQIFNEFHLIYCGDDLLTCSKSTSVGSSRFPSRTSSTFTKFSSDILTAHQCVIFLIKKRVPFVSTK
jgi:hypothetical protein